MDKTLANGVAEKKKHKKAELAKQWQGNVRPVIEQVQPCLNHGTLPVKRVEGEWVNVKADIFSDGHDHINARLQYQHESEKKWSEVPMKHLGNDAWGASFQTDQRGAYYYRIIAFGDEAETWLDGFAKKTRAGEHMMLELRIGAQLLRRMAAKVKGADQKWLLQTADQFEDEQHYDHSVMTALGEHLALLIARHPIREHEAVSPTYTVLVDRKKALFSSWYEFFPRSASPEPGKHGTFKDCERILPRLAEMGFDVVYFPPIHPIGRAFRKGKNNSVSAQPGEPGSPWAIGAAEGGHKAILPDLGTEADFVHLVKVAKELGIDIAMDLAFQCSPEHPYVKEHPQWFKWRPDGTVQYAENPPKKYQDVLPVFFETEDWENLWLELKSVVVYWIERGIQIFRVDNPHTKPFVFWQWLLAEIRREYPDVLFLSEAFTRPKVTARLSKIGFHQAYTYFTWRQTKAELIEYLTQLTQTEWREHFRPNFWPNTPDILPYYLQNTGYSHSAIRFVLAATLSSNYGMYGPVYEQLENTPYPGKEEYLNSEKYEIRHWDWFTPTRFTDLITKVNQVRKQFDAFQTTFNIRFCDTTSEHLLAYFKTSPHGGPNFLVVVNLHPETRQIGHVHLPPAFFGLRDGQGYWIKDHMNGAQYYWQSDWNYVELDPGIQVAHIFEIFLSYP